MSMEEEMKNMGSKIFVLTAFCLASAMAADGDEGCVHSRDAAPPKIVHQLKHVGIDEEGIVHLAERNLPPRESALRQEGEQCFVKLPYHVKCENGQYYSSIEVPNDEMNAQETEDRWWVKRIWTLIPPDQIPQVCIRPLETQVYEGEEPLQVYNEVQGADGKESFIGWSALDCRAVTESEVERNPYFSSGRLDITWSSLTDSSKGTAVAVAPDLIVTCAHNVVRGFNGNKERASRVAFHHKLMASPSPGGYVAAVMAHCYVHPSYEESGNPSYDVAVIFLEYSLNVKPKEFMQLRVTDPHVVTQTKVGSYPFGVDVMQRSQGSVDVDPQLSEQAQITYHTAATEKDSSGAGLTSKGPDGRYYVDGIHTRGSTKDHPHHNKGVRMRPDIIEFLDHCIDRHLRNSPRVSPRCQAARLAEAEAGRVEAETRLQRLLDALKKAGIDPSQYTDLDVQ